MELFMMPPFLFDGIGCTEFEWRCSVGKAHQNDGDPKLNNRTPERMGVCTLSAKDFCQVTES
jgi:hypothetical protein